MGEADAGELAKARLREALRQAMRARDGLHTRVLRTLIAALDNAEAAPIGDQHERYQVRRFGDGSAEVPRVRLGPQDVTRILQEEIASRRSAAADLARAGQDERAQALIAEIAVVEACLETV